LASREILVALATLLGLTTVERDALAAEVKISSRTIGEGYVVLAPGIDEPRLIRRRRLVQYVNLGAYELLPPTEPGPNLDVWVRPPERGQLEIVASLRLRHDFGEFAGQAGPDSTPLVSQLERRQLDLMYGYLQGRRLGGFLDLRVGRQFESSGLDWYVFDGGWTRVHTPAHLAVEVFAGQQVDGSRLFGYPTADLDGTAGTAADRARSPMIGAALALTELRWIHARVAYRRTFTPASINRNLLEPTGDADGSTQPLASGVDQEIVSAAVDMSLAKGKLAPFAAARMNVGTLRLDQLTVGTQVVISDMHTLRVQYLRSIPSFDLDSIFNLFTVQPFDDLRVVYQIRPSQDWTLLGRGSMRMLHNQTSTEGLEPDRRTRLGWTGALAAAWRNRRFAARGDAFVQGGEGGLQAGASLDSQVRVAWDRLGLDLRSYFTRYVPDSDETRGRDGWGWSIQTGAEVKIWEGVHLTVLAEELLTASLRPAFRALGVLAVDWSFRGGRRRS
jgi:hypothetical protein